MVEISGWERTAVLAAGAAGGVILAALIIHGLTQAGVLAPGPGARRY